MSAGVPADDRLTGCCGLDCGACNAFVATKNDDAALRAKTAVEWSKLFGREFEPEDIHCAGCRADGRHVDWCETGCEVRRCALRRGVTNCGECTEYGCAVIIAHLPHIPSDARARLAAIAARRR